MLTAACRMVMDIWKKFLQSWDREQHRFTSPLLLWSVVLHQRAIIIINLLYKKKYCKHVFCRLTALKLICHSSARTTTSAMSAARFVCWPASGSRWSSTAGRRSKSKYRGLFTKGYLPVCAVQTPEIVPMTTASETKHTWETCRLWAPQSAIRTSWVIQTSAIRGQFLEYTFYCLLSQSGFTEHKMRVIC